ncbi:hypothetical protein FGG08_004970 [Glutinoglossum americanum]|uniref:Heterokaryon incompatibility domain-containing protein n=1 Tax=Glutinoglossum americanum TaxID=1670608 RepID=A0A9P8I461_9PEZI|nr:hypothetical protein FGG08_004970 [Glutinoglossum americanum]
MRAIPSYLRVTGRGNVETLADETQLLPAKQLCSTCEVGLAGVKADSFYFEEFAIGTLPEIRLRSEHCPFCRLICSAICDGPRISEDGLPEGIITVENYYGQRGFVATGTKLGTLVARVGANGEGIVDKEKRGRIVTRAEIDPMLIRKWVRACEEHHDKDCQPKPRTMSERGGVSSFSTTCGNLRFIDVHDQCIVDAPAHYRYLALSYVWGLVPTVRLRKDNISQLMKPSGLATIHGNIPLTIRDAMELVSMLGERYLWVDSLCLIEDDEDDMRKGIQTMDLVYEGSYLTIVAASGAHANAGLPGVQRGSRIAGQCVEEVKPGVKMVVLRELDDYLLTSKYSTRGWTFQELILSHRSLIFVNDQIYFRCHQCTWSEQSSDDEFPTVWNKSTGSLLTFVFDSDFSPAHAYQVFILYYSSRQLTKDSDAIDAVSALLKPLAIRMKSRLLEGLPTSSFDMSILFSPRRGSLRRRSGFPSYSWAGWQGQVAWHMAHYEWPEDEDIPLYEPRGQQLDIRDWLNQKTWIVWYETSGTVGMKPVWDLSMQESFGGFAPMDICYRERRHEHPNGRPTVPTIDISGKRHREYPILQFWTTMVYLSISAENALHHEPADLQQVKILARDDAFCGSMLIDDGSLLTDVSKPLRFLVLSESRYSMANSWIPDRGGRDPGLEDPTACDLYWVMLVDLRDGLYERRGLGQIYQSAVERSYSPGPVWEEIALG